MSDTTRDNPLHQDLSRRIGSIPLTKLNTCGLRRCRHFYKLSKYMMSCAPGQYLYLMQSGLPCFAVIRLLDKGTRVQSV